MMDPSEYIISELNSFISKFPKTKVRYENHTVSITHFVEVVPLNIYSSDTNYIKWEENFYDSFVAKYPDQNICFISDDALVGLEKIDFEKTGCEFVEHNSVAHSFSEKKELSYDLKILPPTSNHIDIKVSEYSSVNSNMSSYISFSNAQNKLIVAGAIETKPTRVSYENYVTAA